MAALGAADAFVSRIGANRADLFARLFHLLFSFIRNPHVNIILPSGELSIGVGFNNFN